MARPKANPYETQAKLSLLLAVIAALSAVALIACVFFRHFDFHEFTVYYVSGNLRHIVILGSTAIGLVASGIGWLVAFNAAGQKRNPLSGLAWKMFFVHSALIVLMFGTFVVFWLAKERIGP